MACFQFAVAQVDNRRAAAPADCNREHGLDGLSALCHQTRTIPGQAAGFAAARIGQLTRACVNQKWNHETLTSASLQSPQTENQSDETP
jgi:hypothetical protein